MARVDSMKQIEEAILAGTVLAVDPGNVDSGWVSLRADDSLLGGVKIFDGGVSDNLLLRVAIGKTRDRRKDQCMIAIECPRPQGMLMSSEMMETMIQIGRILQTWGQPWTYVFRGDVKKMLCGATAATDRNVNLAIKEFFGGESVCGKGKKCKFCKGKGWLGRDHATCRECGGSGWMSKDGPLAAFADHMWPALGVGLWYVHNGVVQHTIALTQKVKDKPKKPKKARTSKGVPK